MGGYYGRGGAAAATFNQYASFAQVAGPASYVAGGFEIDLSDTYSALASCELRVKKGTRGNVPFGRLRVRLNVPSAGRATVLVMCHKQETTTAFVTASGQPAGVTLQAASGATTSAEAAHVHAVDHDHPNTPSSTDVAGGAGSAAGLIGATHTHNVNFPLEAFASGAGGSHSHVDNSIYAHTHAVAHTVTNLTEVELAAAVNLSATTFFVGAVGVRG